MTRRGWVIALCVAAIALTSAGAYLWIFRAGEKPLAAIEGIGGPFSLVDQRGRRWSERDLPGKATLLFFGFTACPDVCPTALADLTSLLAELGKDGLRLNVLFVSVDPSRDTPEALALYLTSFDARIVGLTGTDAEVAAMIKAYRAYARQVRLDGGGYTMDHTASVYMLNAAGQFVGTFNRQDAPADVQGKIRRLLAG